MEYEYQVGDKVIITHLCTHSADKIEIEAIVTKSGDKTRVRVDTESQKNIVIRKIDIRPA